MTAERGRAALAPEGPIESVLAEAIVMDEWRLTRARQVEKSDLLRAYMSAKPEDQFISGAETWLAHSKELATLTLYERRINRVLTRNKVEFESRQAARRGAILADSALAPAQCQSPEAEAPSQPAESIASGQPNGFVHSSANPSAAPDPQRPAAQQPAKT